ncbi:nucleotide-diphospho-sugar transferase [Gorgonomyces haynaldii]|nr:nucleotide-diphospho-sugar transferase [Gorgonomyces haynaldii]
MIDPKALMGILLILLSIYLYSSSQTPKTDTPEKLTSRPFFLPVFSKQQVRWIWIYALLATITTSVFVFFEQDEQGMHATGWGPFGIKHGSWMATVEEHLYGTRKRAYMFYAMNPDYACNTLISIDRLKKAGADPKIDFALIYSDNIGEQYIQKFKNLGVKMIKKTPWNQEEPEQWLAHYSDSLTKLYVFEDLGYDKIVFIDSDTLIMRNLDHLFLLPPIETYWAPRAYWLNQPFITSVLLVVDPKFGQLQKLRDWLKHEKGNVFDMDTLNLMWINKAGILPEEYTILDKDFEAEYIPEHETRFSSAFVIHFSSFLGKPWYTPHEQMVRDPHRNPILYRVFDMYWEERNRVCKFE